MPRTVIGIVGAADPSPAHLDDARRMGRLVAGRGWVVLTGGRDAGVMAAATAGAGEVPGSLTVGVLPGRSPGDASPAVDVAIVTGMGDARNAINVLSCHAVVACGIEGSGTASEVALALKAGVPTILLRAEPDARSLFHRLGGPLLHVADSPEDALTQLEVLVAGPPHD